MNEGPPLSVLLHRLSECPPIFLEEPRIGETGRIDVAAVAADVVRSYAGNPAQEVDVRLWTRIDATHRNRLRLILLACWLISDEAVRAATPKSPLSYPPVHTLLSNGFTELAKLVDADKLMASEERREELVRYCLDSLGLVPAGESREQAEDRLATLSSVAQQSILEETARAQRRAEEIRAALKRKAAEEAAAKVSRE